MQIKLPNELFVDVYGDPFTVIASAYISGDEIGYLLCASARPYYRYLKQYESEYGTPYTMDHKVFENIVPAVAHYHEVTGCY